MVWHDGPEDVDHLVDRGILALGPEVAMTRTSVAMSCPWEILVIRDADLDFSEGAVSQPHLAFVILKAVVRALHIPNALGIHLDR